VFSLNGSVVRPTPGDVYGVVSLAFWAITLIVSIKYRSAEPQPWMPLQ
jgi:KUP system potassium uptake protein